MLLTLILIGVATHLYWDVRYCDCVDSIHWSLLEIIYSHWLCFSIQLRQTNYDVWTYHWLFDVRDQHNNKSRYITSLVINIMTRLKLQFTNKNSHWPTCYSYFSQREHNTCKTPLFPDPDRGLGIGSHCFGQQLFRHCHFIHDSPKNETSHQHFWGFGISQQRRKTHSSSRHND